MSNGGVFIILGNMERRLEANVSRTFLKEEGMHSFIQGIYREPSWEPSVVLVVKGVIVAENGFGLAHSPLQTSEGIFKS